MEIDGVRKCLTITEEFFHVNSVKTHLCNESDTWEYNETDHTLKSNGKCLTSSFEATEVWAGNLSEGTYAVLLLNRASISNKIEFSWKELGIKNDKVKLRDLWERKDLGEFKDKFIAYLGSHDSQLLKVFPVDDKEETEEKEEEHKIENIVMIVLGAIILIGICAFVYIYIVNRKKQRQNEEDKGAKDNLIDKGE